MQHTLTVILTALAIGGAQAAVTVTDQGASAPILGANDTGYTGAPDNRFSWDPNDDVGQTFTLSSSITLGSIFIAYNDFDDGDGTFTMTVDAGNNGSNEITEAGVLLDNSDFSGASSDERATPFYWMEWDLSSHNLTLPAGTHKFLIDMTAENGGSKGWALAPMYNSGNVYAGGSEQGLPTGGDFLFAVTAVPEPSIMLFGSLGLIGLLLRRRS